MDFLRSARKVTTLSRRTNPREAASSKALLNTLHGAAVLGRRVRVLSRLLAQYLPDSARVLDVGTGDGSIAAEIKRLRPDVTILGVDVLLRPSTQIPVVLFDGAHLPLEDASVDVVTFVDVLHHTQYPLGLLQEAARVTRRHVLIKDHLKTGILAYATLRAMDWVGNYGHGVALPYNYLSLDEWGRSFRDAKLRPEAWLEKLHLYPFPAGMIFDRRLHFLARLARE
ncbi:MAG: methyltransferase domain-containing protein [Hyphomicrobiales bacterium]|nr:methyltransferase domain-containing protein [Hyphomicrobiales bacterium]